MNFPSELDFLEAFGLDPVETDTSTGMCRYIQNSKTSGIEIDISFSAVMKSFQVALRLFKHEIEDEIHGGNYGKCIDRAAERSG